MFLPETCRLHFVTSSIHWSCHLINLQITHYFEANGPPQFLWLLLITLVVSAMHTELSQVHATYVITFKRRIETQRFGDLQSTMHKHWSSGDLGDHEAMSPVWLKITALQLLRYAMNKSGIHFYSTLSYCLPNTSRKSQAQARLQRNLFWPSAPRATILHCIFPNSFNKLHLYFKATAVVFIGSKIERVCSWITVNK